MIPFIRAFPDGSYCVEQVERPADVDVKATRFIAHGGRYFIAIMSDEEVRLNAATLALDGNWYDVANETGPNSPALLGAVDRLVAKSVLYLDAVQ